MGPPKPRGWVRHKYISKESISVCILIQMLHVHIPNLIHSDHLCMHIVDQYKHLQINPPIFSLFVHKSILDPWERSLQHAHPPLSCLSCRCCLPSFPCIHFALSTCWCQRTKDVLARFIQVFPLHVTKGWVYATPCPCQPKNIFQLLLYIL